MSVKTSLPSLVTDHQWDADIVSVLGAASVAVFLDLSIYTTIHTGTFQYTEFGTAVGLMLAGLGGGYFATSKTASEAPKD